MHKAAGVQHKAAEVQHRAAEVQRRAAEEQRAAQAAVPGAEVRERRMLRSVTRRL